MSRETRENLQRNFLIGNCKFRPAAWHNDPKLRQQLGIEDNHYDDPIPYSEVMRRLFSWEALSVPKANLIPCDRADADYFMEKEIEDGNGGTTKVELPVRVSISKGEQGIIRSDTGEHIATHSSSYKIHPYEQWLLQFQSNLLGDSLVILGAGTPKLGAQAYVQVAMPTPEKDEKTGIEFMPYVLGSTSLDGSIPTTFGAGSLLVVCDNTRDWAVAEQQRSGRVFKLKHTSRSLESTKIEDVREALKLVNQAAEMTVADLHLLSQIKVSKVQLDKVFDLIIPIPAIEDGASKKGVTYAENRRDELVDVYFDRGATKGMMKGLQGNAFGVLQAVNTWVTHVKPLQGNRFERNIERTIKGGFADVDKATMKALAEVLDKPELVAAN